MRSSFNVLTSRGRWRALAAVGILLSVGAARADDLGQILLKKGLITADELKQAQTEEKQKAAEEKPKSASEGIVAKLPKWVEMITPFGDVRVRNESFSQNELHDRDRVRFRARLGLTANVSDEVSGTIRLANGSGSDPISTNQSTDTAFSRGSVNLDWAYITLKPGKSFGLEPGWITVTGGKFGVNAYRPSEVVWDDDLAPEGATETLTLLDRKDGFLRGARVHAFQWVIGEVADGSDPWIPGGQVVTESSLDNGKANWTVAVADYYYDHPNTIARNFLNKSGSNYNKNLANSNSVLTDASGNIYRYESGFNVLNVSTALDAPNAVLGVPAGAFGDVAYNTQATGRNLGFYTGVGVGTAGRDYYRDALKNRGDWGVSYTYAWVEKDAVPSIFTFSDMNEYSTRGLNSGDARPTQKGSTNLASHIVRLDYAVLNNLQLTARTYIENVLDRSIATTTSGKALTGNPTLVRTQVDLMLKF